MRPVYNDDASNQIAYVGVTVLRAGVAHRAVGDLTIFYHNILNIWCIQRIIVMYVYIIAACDIIICVWVYARVWGIACVILVIDILHHLRIQGIWPIQVLYILDELMDQLHIHRIRWMAQKHK